MSLHRAVGVFGAFVLACAPAAAQPQAPDLSDLRDAITAADKKGENVGAIREAFTAFSKALAKSGFKPGEAPPELTALRDAVEMALKKGENVEAVGRELGKVEKAVSGREYERPKPPEPAKEPEFQPPVRPGMGRPGFGRDGFPPRRGGIVIGTPAGMSSTQITISGGNFTVKAKQNDVTYEITGATAGDDPPKIVIRDGEKKPIEADDVKKVPEEYRPTVEKLLGSIRRP